MATFAVSHFSLRDNGLQMTDVVAPTRMRAIQLGLPVIFGNATKSLQISDVDTMASVTGTFSGTPVANARHIAVSPDGTTLFWVDQSDDIIEQATMTTAWDVSTAAFDTVNLNVATEAPAASGIFVNDAGTKMFVTSGTNDAVTQYTLTTAWDLSTATYDSVSFSVATEAVDPFAVDFKRDGTRMFILDQATDSVYQYTLDTAWDVSTATYDAISFSFLAEESLGTGVKFRPDGVRMYIVGSGTSTIYQYSLTTAWDLSTASYDGVSFSVATQDGAPYGMAFDASAEAFIISGDATDTLYQYSIDSITAIDGDTSTRFDTATDPERARKIAAFGPADEAADALEITATTYAVAHYSLYTQQIRMTTTDTATTRLEAVQLGTQALNNETQSSFYAATDADRTRTMANGQGPASECADALEVVV